MRFTGLALRGRAGPLSIELMQSSVGPFPLAANVPDPYAWDELVRTEVISDSSWLVASRAKHGGPTRKVVVRIADRFGEDLLCTAEEDVDAAHPDAAVFADLEGICRTMQLATGAGPCAPAQTTPPP